MSKTRFPIAALLRTLAIGAFVAVVAALPLLLDWATTLDALHGSAPVRPKNAVAISEEIEIAPTIGLSLEKALLSGEAGASRRFFLDDARLRLVAGKPKPSRAPAPATTLETAITSGASVVLRKARLEITTSTGGSHVLTDVTAELGSTGSGKFSLTGLATYNAHRFQFRGDWGSGTDASAPNPLTFSIKANLLQATFEGQYQTHAGLRLEGHASVAARKLRVLARWLGLPVAAGDDLRDFAISGRMEASDGAVSFALANVRVDGNEGSGALTLKTNGSRPAVDGTLGFDRFDASRYVSSLMDERDPATTPAMVPPPEPARSLLSVIDADLRLSAAKVVAPMLETGRAAATIALRQGRLQADLAELEIERGRADGQVTVDMQGEAARLGVRGKLYDVDPGRIFSQYLKRAPLVGRLNAAVDVGGTGRSMPAILPQLAGKATFTLAEGGKIGLDLRTLFYAAQSTQFVGWSAAGKGTTAVDRLEGRLAIASSGFALEALKAKSGSVTYLGTGKVDIAERLLDIVLTLGRGPSEPAAKTVETLAIRGTWSDPAISYARREVIPETSASPGLAPTPAQLRN